MAAVIQHVLIDLIFILFRWKVNSHNFIETAGRGFEVGARTYRPFLKVSCWKTRTMIADICRTVLCSGKVSGFLGSVARRSLARDGSSIE
jgi:ABC-type thiamin/hydroxymethylpyrimidine transport system permease subunit